MVKIVETTIDAQSNAKLTRPNRLPRLRRAFATIFSEELRVPEIALLSESHAYARLASFGGRCCPVTPPAGVTSGLCKRVLGK